MLFNYLNFQFSKSWRFWDSFSLACWAIRSSLVPLYPMLISIMPLSWCSGGLCPKLVAGPSAQKNYFFLDPLAVFLGAASSKISDLAFLTRFKGVGSVSLAFFSESSSPFLSFLLLSLFFLALAFDAGSAPAGAPLMFLSYVVMSSGGPGRSRRDRGRAVAWGGKWLSREAEIAQCSYSGSHHLWYIERSTPSQLSSIVQLPWGKDMTELTCNHQITMLSETSIMQNKWHWNRLIRSMARLLSRVQHHELGLLLGQGVICGIHILEDNAHLISNPRKDPMIPIKIEKFSKESIIHWYDD